MHEAYLTQQIIEVAENFAKDHNAANVSCIHLLVGEASGCVADSIELYFDIYAEGSLCEGAILNIERIKPKLKCKKCGSLFERVPFSFICTEQSCGGEGEPTEIGNEFQIRSIEIN